MKLRIDDLFGPWVRELDRPTLRADALAGLLGALLVLPQGIAFATLAGLPPQFGLYTAIVPCVVAALFGSSRHVMSGPTNAISLALFAMLAPLAVVGSDDYVRLALAVTLLVGLLQLLVGALRLGLIADFISPSVMLGFMGGAAVLIALYALPAALGLEVPDHSLVGVLRSVWAQRGDVQGAALVVSAATLVVAVVLRRLRPRWPALLIALVAGSVLALALPPQPSVLAQGAVPRAWPPLSWPGLDLDGWRTLAGPALALTIVALGQSIAIAKVLAARSGQRVDANRELLGQGLSNIAGAFFSCYVSCGSLNRSLPNFEVGARTPLASVLSALWLLALLAFAGGWLASVPLAAVSALLLMVAAALIDHRQWRQLARLSREETAIAGVTFVATLLLRLDIAIIAGTALAIVAYLYRTSRPAMRTMGFDRRDEPRKFVVLDDAPAGALPECPQLKLLRMEGSVYFGATTHVSEHLHALRQVSAPPKHLLVMAKSMNFIDLAGAELWRSELAARHAMGGDLYFHRPRPPVVKLWQRTGFVGDIGSDHLFPDKATAIATIVPKLDGAICANCTARIFRECAQQPGGSAATAST
ncbi:MAG TPA: SulP family inorganic anion transporter [Burkholderiaceae bacterium]|nr:SulP family inorganic anion transporter [Burkholderiaceae bacterium]